MKKKKNEKCGFPSCKRICKVKGLCLTHWKQEYDGKKLTPIRKYIKKPDAIHSKKKSFNSKDEKMRMCLRCKKDFLSKCPANRFCRECKRVNRKKNSAFVSYETNFDRKMNGSFITGSF